MGKKLRSLHNMQAEAWWQPHQGTLFCLLARAVAAFSKAFLLEKSEDSRCVCPVSRVSVVGMKYKGMVEEPPPSPLPGGLALESLEVGCVNGFDHSNGDPLAFSRARALVDWDCSRSKKACRIPRLWAMMVPSHCL